MSETNDKTVSGTSEKRKGDAINVAIGAGVGGALGLTVGYLIEGPVSAIFLGVIYASVGAIVAATGHEMDMSDLS
jgi:hypothetical protein